MTNVTDTNRNTDELRTTCKGPLLMDELRKVCAPFCAHDEPTTENATRRCRCGCGATEHIGQERAL
jgi:hypothetical protein